MIRPTVEQLRDPKWNRDASGVMHVSRETWLWLHKGYPVDPPFWLAKFPLGPVPPGQVEIGMHSDMFMDIRRRQFCGETDDATIRRLVAAFI